jgi:hypothetical protein
MSLCASKTGASCSATTPHVSALLDRLLHHAHVLKCGPKSYRTRAGREESAHPRNRADHRAGGALQAPRPRSAVTALALAPCVRRWSLVSQRFAAGAAAPVKPGGRSWPRTAGVRRAHSCFINVDCYTTVVREPQLAGFEVTPTGWF